MPHGTRLYSIASTRYGDNYDGNTVSGYALNHATFMRCWWSWPDYISWKRNPHSSLFLRRCADMLAHTR